MNTKTHPPCSSCGTTEQSKKRRGWCGRCYDRWRYAGRPAEGPPPGGQRSPAKLASSLRNLELAHAAKQRCVAGRVEDYAELVNEFGEPRDTAAARVGVSVRTAQRYDVRLREQVAA